MFALKHQFSYSHIWRLKRSAMSKCTFPPDQKKMLKRVYEAPLSPQSSGAPGVEASSRHLSRRLFFNFA